MLNNLQRKINPQDEIAGLKMLIHTITVQQESMKNTGEHAVDHTRPERSFFFFSNGVFVSRQAEREVIQNRIIRGNSILKSLRDKQAKMERRIEKQDKKVELGRKNVKLDSTIHSTRTSVIFPKKQKRPISKRNRY